MIISIKHEMLVFWATFLCGQAVGVIFDFFRSLRKNVPHSKALVAVEDIVFSILAFKLFFDICYITNNGSLRWYIFASLICSGILYFFVLSKFIFSTWDFCFKIIKKILMPFKKFIIFLSKKSKTAFLWFKKTISKAFSGIGGGFVHFAKKTGICAPKRKSYFGEFFNKKVFTFLKK